MAKQVKGIALIDRSTGEVYKVLLEPELRAIGGRWVRVFQDRVKELLARSPHLRGESLRILLYLTSEVRWGNIIPNTSATALALCLQQSHVSRAYSELVQAGFIIKKAGIYYLSPLYCWRGSERQLREACQELLTPVLKQLEAKKEEA